VKFLKRTDLKEVFTQKYETTKDSLEEYRNEIKLTEASVKQAVISSEKSKKCISSIYSEVKEDSYKTDDVLRSWS
jgi:hypothetical protein